MARTETSIRFLAQIMALLMGGVSSVETIGLSPSTVVVVNSDGAIEQVDTLRLAGQGAAGTGMNVWQHSFDDALRHPGIVARQLGVHALSAICRSCSILEICGAGYYPHRYREGQGFNNVSVYCRDLGKLIGHVRARVGSDLERLHAHLDRSRQGL